MRAKRTYKKKRENKIYLTKFLTVTSPSTHVARVANAIGRVPIWNAALNIHEILIIAKDLRNIGLF